ncbi:MAG: hypothetical protein JNJ49_15715 [Bdellovibrionaceae bacterium]|nr:hypothetical protein [Pseudobdellovibrionaceae bacterium]
MPQTSLKRLIFPIVRIGKFAVFFFIFLSAASRLLYTIPMTRAATDCDAIGGELVLRHLLVTCISPDRSVAWVQQPIDYVSIAVVAISTAAIATRLK